MLAEDHLQLLVHLHHEQGNHSICFVAASAIEDSPKLLPVYCDIGLLEFNQGRVAPPLFALPRVDLREEFRHVRSSRGALLEASLVNLGLEQVWGCDSYLSHDGLLQDLGHMGLHHNGSNIFEPSLVLALVLG